jgi:hypothetical protein
MYIDQQGEELFDDQVDGQPIASTSGSAPPWEAGAAPPLMGFGQRAIVALLLTVVLVPPLAGFYSFFSGIPLHALLWSKEEKGTLASSATRSIGVEVESRKNDFLDALVQLELDQKILDDAEKHADTVPEVVMISAIRAVQGDREAINRAVNNLEQWDIPQDEIDALHAEAKKISADKNAWFKTPEGRWVNPKKPANTPIQQGEGQPIPSTKND